MIQINKTVFGKDTFPNKEVVYKDVDLSDKINNIRMNYENAKDICDLMFAAKYVKEKQPNAVLNITLNYTPYSRMDREINNQVFSLRLFAQIISDMKADNVYIVDPHSKVCEEEFKKAGVNVRILNNVLDAVIEIAIDDFNPDIILLPDKGAYSKYCSILKDIPNTANRCVMYGEKIRDLNNKGKIIGYKIINDESVELENKRVLIIDDICSFGGTAIGAARVLKELGVGSVGLYITHAEYCIGGGDVLKTDMIDKVYTTTSLLKHNYEKGIMSEDRDNEWALNIGVAVNSGKMKIYNIY